MALDFKVKDTIHRITVKFVHAFLPNAKKQYNAKAVLQPELDIHGIASKGEVYNITTSPKVIEEGFNAAVELIYYLAADGYRVNTPLFKLRVRIPGEYDGTETHLPADIHPHVSLNVAGEFRQYIKDHVQVEFDGVDDHGGYIGQIIDIATGEHDSIATLDNALELRGSGLKVEGDAEAEELGVFYELASDGSRTSAKTLVVNEPRLIKVITPPTLIPGEAYYMVIVTRSSVRGHSAALKNTRTVKSDFTITAQA
jgi:hypothetical protein